MKHSPREERRYREDDMRRRGSRSGYRIPDNTEARYPGRSAEGTGRHAASLSHTRPQPPEAYLRSRQSDEARQRQREKKKKIAYMVFTAFCAILIIFMAVLLRSVSDNRSFNVYMDQARTYYYSSDFDGALTYLRKAALIDATDECLAMTAQCYESLGNYDKALETLRRMDVSNPQVSSWIDELEGRKTVLSQTGLVTIASKQYKSDTTGLALDNMGLGNNIIEEVVQLYSLDNLSLAGNNISDISGLSRLGGLVTLNLSNNLIYDISSLASLSGLRTVYLDNNPITDLAPLSSLTNLTTLSIKGIQLEEDQLKALAAALPNCAIHSETVEKKAQDISFGGVTFKTDVTELNLSGMGLQNISALSNCKQLQKLDISGNSISDLSPLMDLPYLRWLNVSNNAVSDLRPLMGMSSLSFLNVSGNYFTSTVPLGNITSLTELHISDNKLTDLSGVGKLMSLQTLGMSNCGIVDEMLMPLYNLTGLRSMNLENNPDISGEAMDNLKRSLYTCQVTHSELSYLINVGGYSIRSDGTNIDMSGLNLYDISNFKAFVNPQTVNFSRNNISNIYVFVDAPNRLNNLESLDISYNMMITSELPLMALRNLRQLNVIGTGLTMEQVYTLKMNLPGCMVYSNYG